MRRVIYPKTRAVEHARGIPGLRPMRLFPVLWPLFQVETTADVYDEQKYELIDHFIERAIEEGGIDDRSELQAFLNLPGGIIDRCLAFLGLIGHVELRGPTVKLTPLGRDSLRAGVRYVEAKSSRQTILIERHTGWPLPRPYYDGDVPVLDLPVVQDEQLTDRTKFFPVFSPEPFRPEVIAALEGDVGRARFNLPSQLRNLRQESVREGYLPCYLIETADGRILAYSNVSQGRDEFLELVCGKALVRNLIQAQGVRDPAETWAKWHAQSKAFGTGKLRRGRNGIWEVVMRPNDFGDPPKLTLARVGGYQFSDNHFLRVWCDDAGTRRQALLERALGIATMPEILSAADLLQRTDELARALEVSGSATLDDLRRHASKTGNAKAANRLETL